MLPFILSATVRHECAWDSSSQACFDSEAVNFLHRALLFLISTSFMSKFSEIDPLLLSRMLVRLLHWFPDVLALLYLVV